MEYLNLLIAALGMASLSVMPWLLVVFFSDHLYFRKNAYSTKEHLEEIISIVGFIILVIILLMNIGYCYWESYRVDFQWFMSAPLLVCLLIFLVALVRSSQGVAEDASLWIVISSFFLLGSSLAWQTALQDYSPKQGFLYLEVFTVFWWAEVILLSRCVMYWRAKIIVQWLEKAIGYATHKDDVVSFEFSKEREAKKFANFIDEHEFISMSDREVSVKRKYAGDQIEIGTVNFLEHI